MASARGSRPVAMRRFAASAADLDLLSMSPHLRRDLGSRHAAFRAGTSGANEKRPGHMTGALEFSSKISRTSCSRRGGQRRPRPWCRSAPSAASSASPFWASPSSARHGHFRPLGALPLGHPRSSAARPACSGSERQDVALGFGAVGRRHGGGSRETCLAGDSRQQRGDDQNLLHWIPLDEPALSRGAAGRYASALRPTIGAVANRHTARIRQHSRALVALAPQRLCD